MSLVATRHVLAEARRVHKRWVDKKKRKGRAPLHRGNAHARPVWVHSKRRRNRYHSRASCQFFKSHRARVVAEMHNDPLMPPKAKEAEILRRLSREWKNASHAEKEDAVAAARDETKARHRLPDPLQEFIEDADGAGERDLLSKPWGLADPDFPLAEEVLRE